MEPVCRSTCYEANTLFSVRHLVGVLDEAGAQFQTPMLTG